MVEPVLAAVRHASVDVTVRCQRSMVHFVERGSGTPILMIHGFCVDHHLLLGLDPLFAVRGQWRRVYVDLPGMGKSAAGPEIESADAVADAVVSFVRKAFANERFAILGNSFGGMIARHVAAEFGDQVVGLALLCPVAVADHAQRVVPPQTILQKDPDLLASLDPEDAADHEEMAVVQYRSPTFVGPTVMVMGQQDHVVGFHDQIALSKHYVHSAIAVPAETPFNGTTQGARHRHKVEGMHRYGSALTIFFLTLLGLGLAGCDGINPDMGQRKSMSETVIQAARDGDKEKLLDLASVEMEDREIGADALISMAGELRPGYKLEYQEPRGSPDYCIVSAIDDQGTNMAFDLSWRQSKWHLVLGTAGPPKSPAAERSP